MEEVGDYESAQVLTKIIQYIKVFDNWVSFDANTFKHQNKILLTT